MSHASRLTVRAASLTGMTALCRSYGVDAGVILRQAGLPSSIESQPDRRVAVTSVNLALELAALTCGCPDFGLRLSELRGFSNLGPISLLARDEPTVVVATGPLCNIGLLLLKHPHVLPKIKQLIWMGGVFYRKSEIITPTEFNAFCDPEALKIVLDSGVPITMVGLDVTMQVLVEAPQYAELAKIDTPLGKLVNDWLLFYEKLHRNSMGVGGAMHDPLALALVIDPTLVRTRPAHIGVDLSGSYTFGATVADFWGERGLKDNALIANEVDSDRFFKLMFDLLRD